MKNKLMQLSVLLLSLTLTACMGDRKMSSLLDNVPAGVDYVAVGNVRTVIESAGGSIEGSRIILPKYLRNEVPTDELEPVDDALKFLERSGVDVTACALAGNYDDYSPTLVFSLDDEEQFARTLKNEDFEKESTVDDLVIYVKTDGNPNAYHKKTFVGVNGSVAYLIPEVSSYAEFDGERAIKRMAAKAADESFASTPFADYILKSSTVGIAAKIPSELRDKLERDGLPTSLGKMLSGVVCFKGELDGDKLTLKGKLYNRDGEEKDLTQDSKFLNYDAKINAKALDYMTKDECFVYAASIQGIDWDEMLDAVARAGRFSASESAQLTAVKGYLSKLDGTVAMGFGFKGGLEDIVKFDGNPSSLSFTMVVETKEGKAKSVIADLKGLLDQASGTYTATAKGLSVELPDGGGSLNIEAEGNLIVVANHDVRATGSCPALKAVDFGDYMAAAAISIEPGNKLFKDLELKNGVTLAAYSDPRKAESTLTVEVTGDEGLGIVGKLLKAGFRLRSNAEKIESRVNAAAAEPEPDYMGD